MPGRTGGHPATKAEAAAPRQARASASAAEVAEAAEGPPSAGRATSAHALAVTTATHAAVRSTAQRSHLPEGLVLDRSHLDEEAKAALVRRGVPDLQGCDAGTLLRPCANVISCRSKAAHWFGGFLPQSRRGPFPARRPARALHVQARLGVSRPAVPQAKAILRWIKRPFPGSRGFPTLRSPSARART